MASTSSVILTLIRLGFALSATLRVNCGNFDLEYAREPIPEKWLHKLNGLQLQDAMDMSVRLAKKDFEMDLQLEDYVLSTGIHVTNESSSHALYLDHQPTEAVKELEKTASLMLKLSSHFVYSECITRGIPHTYCAQYISRLRIPQNSNIHKECAAINARSKDAPGQPYRRLLPAQYSDGLYKIRTSKHNHHLPTPRNVSSQFYEASLLKVNDVSERAEFSAEGKLDRSRNVFFAQWSQFVEQNLVHTVQHTHYNGQPVECCNGNQVAAPRSLSSSCAPLHVSDKDPHYQQFVIRCLNYVRSAITVDPNCELGAINQLNLASDHLDLSQVYGHTKEMTDKLRLHRDGKLKSDSHHSLPSTHDHCLLANSPCLTSGDIRVNVNPYMILQHTIFQLSHNKIAGQLKDLNPKWTDEKLFSTAQKINRAIYQKITYEEWLPMVIGHRQGIGLRTNDEEVTSIRGVSNEFATAAIRFYNSMLPGDLFDKDSAADKLFELRDTFYRPHSLNWTRVIRNKIINSVLRQKAMALDTSYVDDLNVDLYLAKNDGGRESGTDSLALDIMRSRDHGLAGYVNYLNACRRSHENTPTITTWEQLEPHFSAKDLELLRKIYHRVEDIDLIVGAIAELPQNDSLIGQTFSCIIGEQMDKSRRSDPEFYQMDHKLRYSVQNYSAAKLLCDTMMLDSVQVDVFQIPFQHGRNPIVCCDELSNGLDLQLFRNVV